MIFKHFARAFNYYVKEMTENITLWLLTLAVIWISTRPDLRRHGFPAS